MIFLSTCTLCRVGISFHSEFGLSHFASHLTAIFSSFFFAGQQLFAWLLRLWDASIPFFSCTVLKKKNGDGFTSLIKNNGDGSCLLSAIFILLLGFCFGLPLSVDCGS
ncbi:hypothetical protein LINGRAHAP2_LOCUS22340 [Linum grandiflorum]